MKRLLVIEPYYGGSHRQFLEGLTSLLDADVHLITLPARKWKMRMQLSAPWFFEQIKKIKTPHFDTVLCSSFVDVALLRALACRLDGWNGSCRFCTYFHENQFVYPQRIARQRYQFAALNFSSALASDAIGFNSHYNRKSFFEGVSNYITKAADMDLTATLATLNARSSVLSPGIPLPKESVQGLEKKGPPILCWNHRWEHDKNPEEFFETLFALQESGRRFGLIIVGQSFKDCPEIFFHAKEKLQEEILHFGFVETKSEYRKLLAKADIVVSTALHEFYGIAVAEAVICGCIPLLPARLSYPELYPQQFLYADGELFARLCRYIDEYPESVTSLQGKIDGRRFRWNREEYIRWLFPETVKEKRVR